MFILVFLFIYFFKAVNDVAYMWCHTMRTWEKLIIYHTLQKGLLISSNETITIRNCVRVYFANVTQHKLRVRVITDISGTAMRLKLISPNHPESCLFKSQVKTSASCKE